MKVLVVYDSKYGNTKLAAQNILDGILSVGGFETDVKYVKDIDMEKIADFDSLVLGAPNHMGMPSRAMKKFIDMLTKFNLKAKYVVVFGTYSGRERLVDRAEKKLEQLVEKKLSKLHLILPGLSIRVTGIKGPIAEGELPKCIEFGKRIAKKLKE